MGVVIQEFEVVAEAQPASQATEPTVGAAPAAQAPTTLDIERILRHSAERSARVWAH